MSAQQLENLAHFPEAVIYPQTAAGLGALGNYAHGIVFFYGQVTLVQDALRRLPHDQPVISRKQLDNFAHALFNAAEAAMEALPAFPSQKWEAGDREFKRRMTVARQARDALPPPA